MISLNSNKATSSVKIDNNISINPYKEIEKISEKIEDAQNTQQNTDRAKAYKTIIMALVSGCFCMKDSRFVLKADDLINAMESLVGEKVRVNVSPSCFGKIYKIDSIITDTKDVINVKYNRADIFEELAELKISTKYVIVA